MIKESILFVTATSLLVYFIMPAAQPPEVNSEVSQEKLPAPAAKKTPPANDGWSYEDSDSDEKPFIFGEPITEVDVDDKKTTASVSEQTSPRSTSRATVDYPLKSSPGVPANKIYD